MIDAINIKNKVNDILTKFDITKPHVDVSKIAIDSGIKIRYEDMTDDTAGLLVINHGKATIVVNSNHHENRQRFTVAHELGHYCLHSIKDGDDLFVDERVFHRDSSAATGTKAKEIEANNFAACLLMPEQMLKEYIDKKDVDLSDDADFYSLSEKFSVSEQAMGYRLGKLGLFS